MSERTDTAPALDLFFALLHSPGWSIGDEFTTEGWLVTGTNGDTFLVAGAATQAEDTAGQEAAHFGGALPGGHLRGIGVGSHADAPWNGDGPQRPTPGDRNTVWRGIDGLPAC